MAEYFETENAVKGYDSRIVARILSYLRPYRKLMITAFFALAVSTAGELWLPVLIQRVLDDAILASYYRVDLERAAGEDGKVVAALTADKRAIRLDRWAFVPKARAFKMTGAQERALVERGALDASSWYAFRLQGDDPSVVAAHPLLFTTDGTSAALRKDDLPGLTVDERRTIRSGDLGRIRLAVVSFFAILLVVLAATFAQIWSTTLIGQKVMKDIRLSLFERTSSQSLAFLSRHPVGRIVTRLTGDVETINEFFTSVLVAFLKDVSVMVGVLVMLFFLSPQLALITLLTLPPVAIVTAVSRFKARDAFRRQRIASSRVNAYLAERLAGIQVVQLFAREKTSSEEFGERNQELLNANLGEMYVIASFRPVVEFLSTITTAAVIVTGAAMALDLSLTLGVLIAFINLVHMFYSPVADIAEKYTLLQSAMAGGERVFAFMDADERIRDDGRRALPGPARGHIEFDHVRFGYKAGESVLKDLSFRVEPGQMVAVVGYTGAGKTTVTNLLARLWDVDAGIIRLDGIPIRDLPLDELRRSVLPVLQEVFLFSGTVADNIRLGLPLSDEEVEAAARAVHAHEFISRLPDGYKTVLSEGATNVSSGQRQLISFARVVAHDPRIVILDEATSSIDTETERLIQLGLARILAGRTSVVIAHRLSTIKHADKILVLSGGILIEEGTHDELIARDGLYARLYRLQYERAAG